MAGVWLVGCQGHPNGCSAVLGWLSPEATATRHHTTNVSITGQHVSIVERLVTTQLLRLTWVHPDKTAP